MDTLTLTVAEWLDLRDAIQICRADRERWDDLALEEAADQVAAVLGLAEDADPLVSAEPAEMTKEAVVSGDLRLHDSAGREAWTAPLCWVAAWRVGPLRRRAESVSLRSTLLRRLLSRHALTLGLDQPEAWLTEQARQRREEDMDSLVPAPLDTYVEAQRPRVMELKGALFALSEAVRQGGRL